MFRLSDYFEQGRVEIFDCCINLIKELKDYKFKPRSLDDKTNAKDEPIDKNDHSICALEWIVMELPADPKRLYLDAYDAKGRSIEEKIKKQNFGGWQLGDPEVEELDSAFGIEGGDLYG